MTAKVITLRLRGTDTPDAAAFVEQLRAYVGAARWSPAPLPPWPVRGDRARVLGAVEGVSP